MEKNSDLLDQLEAIKDRTVTDLERAIDELESLCKKQKSKHHLEVIALKGAFSDYRESMRANIISSEAGNIEKARIRRSFLTLLAVMEKEQKSEKEPVAPVHLLQKLSSKAKYYGFFGLLLAGMGTAWFYRPALLTLRYDEVHPFSEGLAVVRRNERWGFIDQQGNSVIPLRYDYAEIFSEGAAMVRLNGKCGFVDKQGLEVTALKYEEAYSFSEGLAGVKLGDKWGFTDNQGNEVIPPIYDHVDSFSEGRAYAELNGEAFYINKKGERIN